MTLCNGVPVWHASVSRHGEAGPVPVKRWTREDMKQALLLARGLLDGVGVGETYQHVISVALHLRRRLSAAELARLPAAWLALPAVDMA